MPRPNLLSHNLLRLMAAAQSRVSTNRRIGGVTYIFMRLRYYGYSICDSERPIPSDPMSELLKHAAEMEAT